MKMLHLLPSVDPTLGGPPELVRQLGELLVAQGHGQEVATLDDPGAPHLADFPLRVHALGPGRGTYGYTPRLVPWLLEQSAHHDLILVHGLWQFHGLAAFRALRRLGKPYYVFPHGMLDPWFKRAYPLKHLKKWLYWPWAEYRVLRGAEAVLFTCESERALARQSFWLYAAKERVVNAGIGSPPGDAAALREAFLRDHPQLRGHRIVLFLGRIHEKKGCDLLVQAFARVAHEDPALRLVMAGPDPTGLAASLKETAAAAGMASRICWPGLLQGDVKWGAFYASEVFVLPSHQENFGLAVAEALGCGVPVLVSDQVNIWREIESDGAGLVAADTLEGTESLLRRWLGLSDVERKAFAARARHSFRTRFDVAAMARALLGVLAPHGAVHADRTVDHVLGER